MYYTSPDFQCDWTGGAFTMLCADWETGVAWLEINRSLYEDETSEELKEAEEACKEWGRRTCCSIEDFNRLLKGLGDDAFLSAELPDDEDDENDFGR